MSPQNRSWHIGLMLYVLLYFNIKLTVYFINFLNPLFLFSRGNHLERLGRPYKKGKPCSGCPNYCRLNKLCTNACPVADFWANCAELYRIWPHWLCSSDTTLQGRDRRQNCRATCGCVGKIKWQCAKGADCISSNVFSCETVGYIRNTYAHRYNASS